MNLINADYITINDNVSLLEANPHPTMESDRYIIVSKLPAGTIVRVQFIGQVNFSSGAPQGIATLNTGQYIMTKDLAPAGENNLASTTGSKVNSNIILFIVLIAIGAIIAYSLRKHKK